MKVVARLRSLALVILPFVAALPAAAQTSPTPGNQRLGGPVIPGICLLSREAIYANAAIGKAATARLQQLSSEAQAEIDAERRPVDAELRAFRTEAPKLSAEQRSKRDEAFAALLQPIQGKAQLRGREVEATRAKAMQRIADEAQPVIANVYRSKGCGLLLDRNTALGGNFVNDLTADVVKSLDARITTIAFDREALPATAPVASRP